MAYGDSSLPRWRFPTNVWLSLSIPMQATTLKLARGLYSLVRFAEVLDWAPLEQTLRRGNLQIPVFFPGSTSWLLVVCVCVWHGAEVWDLSVTVNLLFLETSPPPSSARILQSIDSQEMCQNLLCGDLLTSILFVDL